MRLDSPRKNLSQLPEALRLFQCAEPSLAQRRWLRRGLGQPGGKLPLFTQDGKRVSAAMVRACLISGWAEPWFANPLKPDWLVCKLTDLGRHAVS